MWVFGSFKKKMDFKVRPDYHKRLEPLKIYHYWIPIGYPKILEPLHFGLHFSVAIINSGWTSRHPCSLKGVPRPHQLDFLMQKVSDWTKLRISPTFLDARRDWVVSCLYMLSQCCPCVFLDLVHRKCHEFGRNISTQIEGIPCRPDRTIPVSVHPEVKADGIIPSYFQCICSSKNSHCT